MKNLNEEINKMKHLFNYKKGDLIVEGTKSYLTEEEKEQIRLPLIKLVTKYKDGLIGFIESLDEGQFCSKPKESIKEAANKLDDFINRIALDMSKQKNKEVTPQQVLEALYDKGNSGLMGIIVKIAKPIIEKFGGISISKEMIGGIENHMRTKYGQIGQ
jgi:hypothetical protein